MNDISHTSTSIPADDLSQMETPTRPQFYIALAQPTWTRVLLVINVIVFVAMVAYGYLVYGTMTGTEDIRVLVRFGAKVNELILAGEYWRLLTAMFIHIGVMHLLFNLYALFMLGPMVEGYFGHWRFLAIYFLAGLYGSVASYAFSEAISAGASGAIFGLAGAITVYFVRYRDNFGAQGRSILQNMLVVIVINLIFGLSSSGIDNFGHIGGLIGGALVAWGLLPKYQRPDIVRLGAQPLEQEDRTTFQIIWILLVIAILVVFFQYGPQINIAGL